MRFQDRPVGVKASMDERLPRLNYDRCFIRDFAICAPAFLLRGERGIVRNFLTTTLRLQSRSHAVEAFQPRKGLMPASFRPTESDGRLHLEPDYGEESIARVTPADSPFWWLITLHAYTRVTGDGALARRDDFQDGIRLVLELVLEGSFEMFPTLLVPDGAFMIDRRMGVYGHPLEVQALFFAALRASLELLGEPEPLRESVHLRLRHLRYHLGRYYWMDRAGLARLRHIGEDQYGEQAVNVFNVFPESIPDWVEAWLPEDAGYFAGNVGPGRIDFRFFTQGNLLAAAVGLADAHRQSRLMRLFESRWSELIGSAPLRIVYPALEGEAWRVVTGADPKNAPDCYHNGGWWPCLLWSFANATVACGRTDLLERAVRIAEERLQEDDWPEYYDGSVDPRPGSRARRRQSWSLAGYLHAKACLRDPAAAALYDWPDDIEPEAASFDPGLSPPRD